MFFIFSVNLFLELFASKACISHVLRPITRLIGLLEGRDPVENFTSSSFHYPTSLLLSPSRLLSFRLCRWLGFKSALPKNGALLLVLAIQSGYLAIPAATTGHNDEGMLSLKGRVHFTALVSPFHFPWSSAVRGRLFQFNPHGMGWLKRSIFQTENWSPYIFGARSDTILSWKRFEKMGSFGVH